MKDNSYYNIDLIINFLQKEKENYGDFIDGFRLTYFIEHIGEISLEEARKRRYEAISKRIGSDIKEAISILVACKNENVDINNAVNQFLEGLKNEIN